MNNHRNNFLDNEVENFDFILETSKINYALDIQNLGGLLFEELPDRRADAKIIYGHIAEKAVNITLGELRAVTCYLFKRFEINNIKYGDTVLLANLDTCCEVYTALLFIALTSYGVKVFLPMYLERKDLTHWKHKVDFSKIILPSSELLKRTKNKRYKKNLTALEQFGFDENITFLDGSNVFDIDGLLIQASKLSSTDDLAYAKKIVSKVLPNDIALLITTSGTSGPSKIVVYNHESFILNISAWKEAGLYNVDKLGGRGFTPLFAHTMGIRYFLNAIFTGQPIILINTDWFAEKPEAVHYFFKKFKPEHITAGPAVFNLLIEMCRVFPSLKATLRLNLKTIVSSGTSSDIEVLKKMEQIFNVKTHNAFGTTETQQITSTVLCNSQNNFLGKPFPGVSIGLKKIDENDHYRLYIKSRYAASWSIGHEKTVIKNRFVYLGDIVIYKNNQLEYLKRERVDFFNDEFGVKIPITKVHDYYHELFEQGLHINLYPLKFNPGLAAIVFFDSSKNNKIQSINTSETKKLGRLFEKINTKLLRELEPMEFSHRTIQRFALCDLQAVKNSKGLISEHKIKTLHGELITALTNDNLPIGKIYEIQALDDSESKYEKYHNPYVGKVLDILEMNLSYIKAKGDYLYPEGYYDFKTILDLTGGYGTNLIGHNNKKLVEHAIGFLSSSRIPLSDQMSNQGTPAKLAEKLDEQLSKSTGKSYYTLFGSTGSEVVEMALHHAYLEWKERLEKFEDNQRVQFAHLDGDLFRKVAQSNRSVIEETRLAFITNRDGFHGNSLGARSLMGENEKKTKFQRLFSIKSHYVDDAKEDIIQQVETIVNQNTLHLCQLYLENGELKKEMFQFPSVIGAILEPIIGEGGIREINPLLPKVLTSYDFPVIFDEIQSGLGRSGTFLASENFVGHYYLFAKALGGNIAKISSISIQKDRYIKEFGKLYISTFSGGAFACSLARENLDIIEKENVPSIAAKKGKLIKQQLMEIGNRFPSIIESVQGKGLMIGIKFSSNTKSLFPRLMKQKKVLGYVLSSYLLRNHGLRILPSISAPNTLRIEPSIHISEKDIQKMSSGLNELCLLLKNEDYYTLLKHLMQNDPFLDNKGATPSLGFMRTDIEPPAINATQVGFVAHFAYPMEEMRMLFKSLTKASDTGLLLLFSKLAGLLEMEPFILNAKNLYNGKIHLTTVVLPLDSASMEKFHRTASRKKIIHKIQKGVDLAAMVGSKYISLGGYNSILSGNGKTILAPEGTKVLTGNTLTSVIGYANFKQHILSFLDINEPITIGIVGAMGNIGKILAMRLYRDKELNVSQILLVGNNLKRLQNLEKEIKSNSPDKHMDIIPSVDLRDLKKCDGILVAVNTNDPIININHMSTTKKIVISDLSVPTALSADLRDFPNICITPFSASIKLEEDPEQLTTSCSPRGTALCCLAEAILNGLEEIPVQLWGEITIDGFERVEKVAKKYGFIHKIDKMKSYKVF
ncbi:aminotransferase class III-fold pyridoxal phosphate-dependent enzyme [Arenibacter sp. ARW7G5Y1]|uniref:aminotransferase class III-fold pyridoxal phosphate-dependent enzyme n=1 Tax=Arenibacter sp. ARW7G5Y1 TaxID=2135619 RepID=UPI000D751B82|nr:aminotransferase class III-fold pyridoxal phosphate-dependent enzyme [Arenibacter sp. ARW7G5Y1]PXX28327.1 acetylornithine/succinyldiaminopimelate/putrescine aminotransferase [Arenibacter sp. ARW7G5Y1]